jgi:hypothetical protein
MINARDQRTIASFSPAVRGSGITPGPHRVGITLGGCVQSLCTPLQRQTHHAARYRAVMWFF